MISRFGVRAADRAPRTTRARTSASALALGLMTGFALLIGGLAGPASATPATGAGAEGQTLSVSQADGLSPDGTVVTVAGSGYNTLKGIYVAFCVTPPAGQMPTPCGGGAAMSGSGGLSGWISSNPPSYGKDLVTPFGDGGTFSMQMTLSPMIGAVDCQVTSCSVVTRADHTRTDDRTADVIVPVTFGAAGTAPSADPTPATPTPPVPAPAPTTAPTATTAATPTAPSTSPESLPTISALAGAAGENSDSGSSAAPIVIGGGILAVLAIGGVGYIAMRRKGGSAGSGGTA